MDDDEFTITIPARRFRGIDLAVTCLGLIRDFAEAVEEALDVAHQLAAQHANYLFERQQMHEQAAREIEALVSGEPE